MSGWEMWAVAWPVILSYLFDNETIIAFCRFVGDGHRQIGKDVMFCDARYVLAR